MKYSLYLGLAILVFVVLGMFAYYASAPATFNGTNAINNYDTTSAGFAATTTTVNTTATQMFASIARISYIVNNTTSTLTCALEAPNTSAASSSVSSGRGVTIGPNNGATIPSVVSFGECSENFSCYRHKGAVNCLANVAASVTKLVQ